jgi:ribosomal protein S18 acetylase RimI-like enzyme
MEIRPAAAADARGIAVVHVRTWQAAYAHALPAELLRSLSVDRREQGWREMIEGGESVLVEVVDERIVGFVAFGPARDEQGVGEVYAIYVQPEVWGTGAGRRLMLAALSQLRERGFDEAVLWVLEDNPRARRFYEAGGWIHDGGHKVEPIGELEAHEVRYRFDLSQPGPGPNGGTHP